MNAKELEIKRKQMSRDSWVKNVMRLYPEKSKEETEALYDKIHGTELTLDKKETPKE